MSSPGRTIALIALTLALTPLSASAQASATATMVFSQYLDRVVERNLDLAATHRDVTAAEARVQIGARLPDPVLSAGLLSFDISHPTHTETRTDTQAGNPSEPVCIYTGAAGSPACRTQLPTVVGAALDVPIELGNQQGGRMDLARVGVSQADAGVDDAVRVIRGQAGGLWVDALATRLDLERLRQTLTSLEALVQMNQTRVTAGSIGDVELVQSRVEAQMFRSQVLRADGAATAALVGLSALLNADDGVDPSFTPIGDLAMDPVTFELQRLVDQAMENRPDLRRIELDIEGARAARRLAEAQRWGTIDILGTWLYSVPGLDTQYAQTDYHAIGLQIAIPLPFRLLWHGEIDEANAMESAADARYQQARQRLEVEIRQALVIYNAAVQARALFDASVIADAEHVLEATRYQYEHGGASLVAVLVAQRTVNDVYGAYNAALAAHAHALVDVETAAGIWDVDFDDTTTPAPPPIP